MRGEHVSRRDAQEGASGERVSLMLDGVHSYW
jgi:hypothetical protein